MTMYNFEKFPYLKNYFLKPFSYFLRGGTVTGQDYLRCTRIENQFCFGQIFSSTQKPKITYFLIDALFYCIFLNIFFSFLIDLGSLQSLLVLPPALPKKEFETSFAVFTF